VGVGGRRSELPEERLAMRRKAYPGTYPNSSYAPETGASAVNSLGYGQDTVYLSHVHHSTYTGVDRVPVRWDGEGGSEQATRSLELRFEEGKRTARACAGGLTLFLTGGRGDGPVFKNVDQYGCAAFDDDLLP